MKFLIIRLHYDGKAKEYQWTPVQSFCRLEYAKAYIEGQSRPHETYLVVDVIDAISKYINMDYYPT